jgi:putative PIG3 family NAD(P)H quinone oxidoreductase
MDVVDVDPPSPGPGDVLIRVAATAVNRADILQRQGSYAPPPGASDILGLECSGVVVEAGAEVDTWRVGERVCALLSGGGYAELVSVPAGQVLPAPTSVSLVDAAALPEVTCTVWANVFMLAALQPADLLLVHGGSSGIGTMAIQLAKAVGARVACTVGNEEKAAFCRRLGADLVINYRTQDFVAEVEAFGGCIGATVILDNMGAEYLARNIQALAVEGRLVVIGMQGGTTAELDLGLLVRKRAAVVGTALRARPAAGKSAIVASVRDNVWPLVEDGTVRPIVHGRIPLDEVRAAHQLVESSTHIGKVVIVVDPSVG